MAGPLAERMENMAYEEKFKTVELPHKRHHGKPKKSRRYRAWTTSRALTRTRSRHECTAQGILIVRGRDLRIEKLSLDSGDVVLEGTIEKLEYEDDVKTAGGGLFSRLFK
jgi:hypothetical protein